MSTYFGVDGSLWRTLSRLMQGEGNLLLLGDVEGGSCSATMRARFSLGMRDE
jgi:hypothetical protein